MITVLDDMMEKSRYYNTRPRVGKAEGLRPLGEAVVGLTSETARAGRPVSRDSRDLCGVMSESILKVRKQIQRHLGTFPSL